jgi:protein-disulfide isomerase
MNSKKITVSVLVVAVLVFFFLGMNAYQKRVQNSQAEKVNQEVRESSSQPVGQSPIQAENRLVRFHSPVFGPRSAPVTIVEFFDPACETCRAFYPIVKAQADAKSPAIEAVLNQDIEDLTALEVTKTPTFFVNGRGLPSFGDQQLKALVAEEVAKSRK